MLSAQGVFMTGSYITGTTSDSLNVSGVIANTVIANSGGNGVSGNSQFPLILVNDTIYNSSIDGIKVNASSFYTVIVNTISYGTGGWGLNNGSPVSTLQFVTSNNAYGSNTFGSFHNLSAGTGDVTLTANPVTNAGSGDFSLNATAGGGAGLKGTGVPGVFPGGTSTGVIDIGAVESQCSGGGAARVTACVILGRLRSAPR